MFLEFGGDSVSAVQMTYDLEWQLKLKLPLLTDKLLHKTFSEVSNYCLAAKDAAPGVYREWEDESSDVITRVSKRIKTDSMLPSLHITNCFTLVNRTGRTLHCSCKNCTQSSARSIPELTSQKDNFTLNEAFRFDLSKCVDASPLIVHYEKGSCVVCIGSHSGKFVAVDFGTGVPFWMTELPDRIESSACLSSDGHSLFVGCYDHCLYCLSISTGRILWSFQSQGEIKSSPICSQNYDMVFVGSHDRHLYCLCTKSGDLLWKTKVGQGSVFSSPGLSKDHSLVFGASLDGTVVALEQELGTIKWQVSVEKPVFSSPLVIPKRGVCVASVSGKIALYGFQGELVWGFMTDGAIFSTPILVGDEIIVGNHGHSVYRISLDSGESVWKLSFDSPIYATPCVVPEHKTIIVLSTNGHLYIVSNDSKKVLTSMKYPGQTFSSPVLYMDHVVVGCRDNNLYCHSLVSYH